jgi:hypothetical protein
LLSTHKESPDLEGELQLSDADADDGFVTDSFLPLMVKERGGLLFLLLLSKLSAEVTQSGSSFPGGANKASVLPPPAPRPFLFLSGPIRFSLSLPLTYYKAGHRRYDCKQIWKELMRLYLISTWIDCATSRKRIMKADYKKRNVTGTVS